MGLSMEALVQQAQDGDRNALESLVKKNQDRVYGLALRMLGHPEDAEDASQEILVKIITRLGSFRQESAFSTWVYRLASNHLLTTLKRRTDRREYSFEESEASIQRGIAGQWRASHAEAEQKLIVEEIRLSCLQAILQCLDPEHRLAYTLVDIFDVTGEQGAYILGITPAAFRKRLSRARTRIREFMLKNCALINPDNPCHCERMIGYACSTDWVDPDHLVYATHPCRAKRDESVLDQLQEIDELKRVAVLFRSHPDYAAPEMYVNGIKELLDSGRYQFFKGGGPHE